MNKLKTLPIGKRYCLIALAILGLSVATQASAATCQSAAQRMAELNNYAKTTDTLVLAHRGYWGKYNKDDPGTPENSTNALFWANANCMDGVEMDVKESKDGVIYLMHDFNLGRTTNVYSVFGGSKYDPMTNQGTNPAVNSLNAADIDKLMLLSPDRQQVSMYRVPRVSGLVRTWVANNYQIPIIFDVKTTSGVRMLDTVVYGTNPASINTMGVKVNATLYPDPAAFYRDATRLQVIPVYTTNMLGVISVADSLGKWRPVVKTIEINVKQHNGLLSFQKQQVLGDGNKVAVFHAIPDGPIANSFYKNTGQCCYKLSDLYYLYKWNRQIIGRDTDDMRGDLGFLVSENFGLLTSDDPRGAVSYLASVGKRNNHFKFY